MKTTFSSHSEVAHVWAQFTHSEGHASNVYFYGDTIYSYGPHFPIAKRHISKNNQVILFATKDYSVSTSQHKAHVQRAIHGIPVLYVDNPTPYNNDHIDNVKDLVKVAGDWTDKAKRARLYGDEYFNNALSNLDTAKKYIEFFQIKSKLPKALKRAVYADIEQFSTEVEKYSKAEKRKRDIELKKRAEIAKKQQIERIKKAKEQLNKWLNGEDIYTSSFYDIDDIFLRVVESENKQIIETSHGAKVGIKAAKLVWNIAKKARDTEQVIETNFKVDYYTFEKADKFGNVKIGCHYIKIEEMERIAKILGWQ